MNKEHTRIDLVEGGNVFRQGDHATLGFIPRDYAGNIVDLTGKLIDVSILGRKGIMFTSTAVFDSAAQVIRVLIDEVLDYGDHRIEFTVTDPNDADYRRKFPSGEYDGRIKITPGADSMDFVGVAMTTVTQLRNEQEAAQVSYEQTVDGKITGIESTVAELESTVETGIGAFTQDSEVVLARGGEVNLGARLDKTNQQLADTEIQVSKQKYFVDVDKEYPIITPESNDTARIQRALDATPIGGTAFFGGKSYTTTATIVVNKNINVEMLGTIFSDHAGVALRIEGLGVGNTFMPNLRVKVYRKTKDHLEGSLGVHILNTYHSSIRIDYVGGFSTGVKMEANNGKGTVYNNISLGQMYDNKIGLHITALAPDWVNQNTFIGGRFYLSNTGARTGYIHIKIDGDANNTPLYQNNGNTFIGTSMEDPGSGGLYAKAVVCNGIFNRFINPRTEGSMSWEFGLGSYRNFLDGGTYVYMDNITDNGTFNDFHTQATGGKRTNQNPNHGYRYIAGASNTVGLEAVGTASGRVGLRAWNTSSGANPSFQVMQPDGITPVVQIRADGIWDVNINRKVMYGRFAGIPSSGTYQRGDISFITNPSLGQPIGYVCTVGDGTTIGTWQPFGQVQGSVTSIGSAPVFIGQLAVFGGIGYLAVGTSSSTDWKQITN